MLRVPREIQGWKAGVGMDDGNENLVAVDHYRLLFEAAPTPLLVLTPDFQIVAVSDKWEDAGSRIRKISCS
jgi:hypothetical protein